jgi:hypothetical protein
MLEKGGLAELSVCVPTYNGAAFLREAIRSVLSQSFLDFELLIVDDGSTDATLDIARSFADPRLRIVQNETRLGIPENWNRALSLSQGEFVCLFHQDDVMLPENLARKVAVLKANRAVSFVHSAIELLVEEEAPTPPANWVEEAVEDFIVDGVTYFRQLIAKNRICAPTVIVRREHLARVGEFDRTLGFTCDYAMWLQLCVEGQVAFLSHPLVLYRWHEKNATHAYRFEKGTDELLAARQAAIRYYEERTGRREEAELLRNVSTALTEKERWAIGFDQESERRLAYIRELEGLRDKLWADVQRVGKGWEDQQTYIRELEGLRDKLWADVQRVSKSWEEQQAYIKDLEQIRNRSVVERTRRLSRRLWELVQKASQHSLRGHGD